MLIFFIGISKVKLFKVASLTGISYLSKLLAVLFIIKQISIINGPEGLGVVGNFLTLVSLASTLGGGGALSGIIKYLSEYSGVSKRQESFVGSSFLYTLIFSLLTLMFGLFFVRQLTSIVFSNQSYSVFIYCFLVAQIIVSINNFSYGMVNGLKKNRAYAFFLVGGNIIAIIFSYFAIKYFGLWGVILAIMAPAVFPFIPVSYYMIKKGIFKKMRFDSFFSDSRLLAKFTLMRFGSAICFPIVEIFVMNQIKDSLGLTTAGFWQAISKLSVAYLSFYSLFLTFYFLPLISSIVDKSKIVMEVNRVMLIIGASFVLMIVLYFIFNSFIIRIILSKEFLPINHLILLEMIGDFFRVLGWVIGFVVISRASIKIYLFGEFFQGSLFALLSYFSLERFHNLRGVILSYDITCLLYFLVSAVLFYLFYVKKDTGFLNSKINLEDT